MSELLAWNGVWTRRMIDLMVPVAISIEADQTRQQVGAVGAAIAGAFQKGGADKFHQALDQVKVQSLAARSRGHVEKRPGGAAAREMLSIFGQMGMKIQRVKR